MFNWNKKSPNRLNIRRLTLGDEDVVIISRELDDMGRSGRSSLRGAHEVKRLPMDRFLRIVLANLIRRGNLWITTAKGGTFTCGDGTGTPVAIKFTTRVAEWSVLLDPELKLGEAYVDGGFVVERGSIADLLAIVLGQPRHRKPPYWARVQWLVRYIQRRLKQFNSRRRAQRNVAHHYDLDEGLYRLFLDADRQYSCGYFEQANQSLDDAQLAKKRHLAAKLLVRPGQRVLDIGCGWGGLALYLSEVCGARVTGITLSKKQLEIDRVRLAERGLKTQVEFKTPGLSGCTRAVRSYRFCRHV